MIEEAAGYSKGKKGKNSIIMFFKTALCCRFEPMVYFIFGQYPEYPGVAVFTLIKLVFETQAAKL